MGYYLETPTASAMGKGFDLIQHYEAQLLTFTPKWGEIPRDKALICVVNNPTFEAAALCYNMEEFRVFAHNLNDSRKKAWLYMDKATAHDLAGFKETT